MPNRAPFAFAGLWAHNDNLDVTSCTILTAGAAKAINHLHNRTPIALERDVFSAWLDPDTGVDYARGLLKQNRGDEMESYRVDREVNSSKASGLDPVEPCDGGIYEQRRVGFKMLSTPLE